MTLEPGTGMRIRTLTAVLVVALSGGGCASRSASASSDPSPDGGPPAARTEAPPAPLPGYVKVQEIALPGSSSFDCLTVDSANRRLYVAHGDAIDAIDLDKGQKACAVAGI